MSGDRDRESRPNDRKKGPAIEPADLSEQLVSGSLRHRRSKCSHGCGDSGCGSGGCGVGSVVDEIRRNFPYDDERAIVEVEFRGFVRCFVDISEASDPVRVRDRIIVHDRGATRWGLVSMVGSLVHAKRKAKRLSGEEIPRYARHADEADNKKIDSSAASERQAFSVCKTRIETFELPMTLVEAEWQFDHRKLTFYFVAENRVDFRALVRDLAAIFNTRIDLRQIPVRDAARRLGGVGVCGRELCCSTYLGRYEHITLEHARIQQIPTNPSKLSGQCGRLKCCLLYEVDTYVEGLKRFPPIDSEIEVEGIRGIVRKIDLFKELLWVSNAGESEWREVRLDDVSSVPQKNSRTGTGAPVEPSDSDRPTDGATERSTGRKRGGRGKRGRGNQRGGSTGG